MQMLTAKCPYCSSNVETTIDHTTDPVKCPQCGKPFEMEIPSAEVFSVRDVSDEEAKPAAEPQERILHKVHPVVFRARPVGALLLLTIVGLSIWGLWMALFVEEETRMTSPNNGLVWPESFNWLFWLSIAGLVAFAGTWAYWFIQAYATTLTVTDSRTIVQRGIISRDTSEVQHDDVRNIQLDQSFWQRLFRTGTLAISSSGQDDMEIAVAQIPSPAEIVNTIRKNQR